MVRTRTVSLALALCLLLLSAPALGFEARTKTVRDGDSIGVIGPEDILVNVRLYGVDAPEAKQPHGYQARKRLSQLVSRKQVSVEPIDTDRYGRTVAIVRLADGIMVNEVLVREGHAWFYPQYCTREDPCRRLEELEGEARAQKRGLWAEDDAVRPSEWRKQHKTEEWYAAPVRAVTKLAKKVTKALTR